MDQCTVSARRTGSWALGTMPTVAHALSCRPYLRATGGSLGGAALRRMGPRCRAQHYSDPSQRPPAPRSSLYFSVDFPAAPPPPGYRPFRPEDSPGPHPAFWVALLACAAAAATLAEWWPLPIWRPAHETTQSGSAVSHGRRPGHKKKEITKMPKWYHQLIPSKTQSIRPPEGNNPSAYYSVVSRIRQDASAHSQDDCTNPCCQNSSAHCHDDCAGPCCRMFFMPQLALQSKQGTASVSTPCKP
jgi:hypothetical protein